jgi:anti-sigma factor RsiW
MSDPAALNNPEENFDNMTPAQFEARLPDLFVIGNGKVSADPRFAVFLERNPDCAALVSDFEEIAEVARSMFDPAEDEEPSDDLWSKISKELAAEPPSNNQALSLDEPNGALE